MSIQQVQRQGFEDRLSRIKKGGANTMGEVHIGPRNEVRAKDGTAGNTVRIKKKKRKDVALGEGSSSVLVPLAIVIGGFSMFVGQAAAYHLFQEGGLIAMEAPVPALEPYLPYAHFVLAGILALMFGWTFRMMKAVRLMALIVGLGAVFYYHSELVARFPGLYASFFSEAFVNETLSQA